MNGPRKKPTSLRDSWRPRDRQGSRAALIRNVLRYASLALLCVLIVSFFYLLTAPFNHPRTYLACLAPSVPADPANHVLMPLEFGVRDCNELLANPQTAWSPLPLERPEDATPDSSLVENVFPLRTVEDFAKFSDQIGNASLGASDVLVLYVAAQGISQDGEAYLLCQDFSVQSESAGRYPLNKLLEQLGQCDAGTKLLCLEMGRMDFDPRLGLIVNEFPRLLESSLAQLKDPRLWVLIGNSELERAGDAVAYRQTVFGRALNQGLSIAGDTNSDQMIDLGELHRYVTSYVKKFVDETSGGSAEQTPRLLHGTMPTNASPRLSTSGSAATKAGNPVIVSVAGSPLEKLKEVIKAAKEVQAPSSEDAKKPNAEAVGPTNEANAAGDAGQGPKTPEAIASEVAGNGETSAGGSGTVATGNAVAVHLTIDRPELPDSRLLDNPNAKSKDMLQLAWQYKDSVEQRSERGDSLIDRSPHHWRALVQMFEAWDQSIRHDAARDELIRKPLRSELQGLRQLLSGQPVTSGQIVTQLAMQARTSDIASSHVRTLGLAEQFDLLGLQRLTPELRNAIFNYEQSLGGDNFTNYEAWQKSLQALPQNRFLEQYFEFWLAKQLYDNYRPSWRLFQLAMQTTRQSEQLNSDLLASNRQVAESLTLADQQRREGLRIAMDQIGSEWPSRAESQLSLALRGLQVAKTQIATLREAVRVRNDLLLTLPEHMQLCHQFANLPESRIYGSQLLEILSHLQSLNVALNERETASIDAVAELRWKLESLKAQIDDDWFIRKKEVKNTAVADTRSVWQVALLLQTPLCNGKEREELHEAIANREKAFRFNITDAQNLALSVGISEEAWREVALRWQFAAQHARLGGFDGNPELLPVDAVAGLTVESRFEAYREAGARLRSFYSGLAGQVQNVLQGYSIDLSREERIKLIAPLRQSDIALRLIDRRDLNTSVELNPIVALERIELYENLLRLRGRNQMAIQDATIPEATFYRQFNDELRAIANGLFAKPNVTPFPSELLEWDGPVATSLVRDPEQTFSLRLRVRGDTNRPVWIVVDHDPQLVQIEVTPKEGLYARSELASAGYPERPDAATATSTLNLAPGAEHRLSVTVRRTDQMAGRTRVIFKAVSGDTYLRHTLEIQLPSQPRVNLLANGPAGGFTELPEGLTLHPWPNRETTYRLSLATQGEQSEKHVDVEVRQLLERRTVTLLPGAVPREAANTILDQLGPSLLLKQMPGLTVPAGGDSLQLPFQPPPKPDGSASNDPAGNGAAAGGPAVKPEPVSVRFGLLFVIRDRDNGDTLFRRIDFRPRRPRSYVRPKVAYDPGTERLEVQLVPIDPSLIPTEGVPVRGEFAVPLPQAEAQLSTVLYRSREPTSMFALIPPETPDTIRLFLHVDGFPRAFTFDISRLQASRDIPESSDNLAARILFPENRTAYLSPLEKLPVKVQVDAPPGAFENQRDVVEIGIDVDRDREFSNEPTIQLLADRQADVLVLDWGPQGEMRLSTKVQDFELELPGSGLRNVRSNLLTRVQVGRTSAWSDPVELIFDATPPVVSDVKVSPPGMVAIGKPLTVAVTADDAGLSGVGTVEVGIDVEGKGAFSEKAPPVAGARNDEGVWIVQLPTQTLTPGRAVLLVRATDLVGNPGPYFKYAVEASTAEMIEATLAQTPNRISGTIQFGTSPLPNADVLLANEKGETVSQTKTNSSGFFRFSAVKPGKYQLSASGVFRNRPRLVKTEVTVEPPPNPPVRLELTAE